MSEGKLQSVGAVMRGGNAARPLAHSLRADESCGRHREDAAVKERETQDFFKTEPGTGLQESNVFTPVRKGKDKRSMRTYFICTSTWIHRQTSSEVWSNCDHTLVLPTSVLPTSVKVTNAPLKVVFGCMDYFLYRSNPKVTKSNQACN